MGRAKEDQQSYDGDKPCRELEYRPHGREQHVVESVLGPVELIEELRIVEHRKRYATGFGQQSLVRPLLQPFLQVVCQPQVNLGSHGVGQNCNEKRSQPQERNCHRLRSRYGTSRAIDEATENKKSA